MLRTLRYFLFVRHPSTIADSALPNRGGNSGPNLFSASFHTLFVINFVLVLVFRGKFYKALKQAFRDGLLNFHGDLALLAQPKIFAAWLRPLFRQDWVVYLKRPFGGPEYVLQYLGRYTHRVAISNHRLLSFADGQVTFRWRDSAHNNEQKPMTHRKPGGHVLTDLSKRARNIPPNFKFR